MESSSRYSRGWLIAASYRLTTAAPSERLPALPERYRLQSPRGSRDNAPVRRALGRESNGDIRGPCLPGSCPSCTSPRGGVPSIRFRLSSAVRRVSGFPFNQRTDFHARGHGFSLPLFLVASLESPRQRSSGCSLRVAVSSPANCRRGLCPQLTSRPAVPCHCSSTRGPKSGMVSANRCRTCSLVSKSLSAEAPALAAARAATGRTEQDVCYSRLVVS
jgi:hypothetical protein